MDHLCHFVIEQDLNVLPGNDIYYCGSRGMEGRPYGPETLSLEGGGEKGR